MRHGLVAHGVEQRCDMGRIVRAGIDDGDLTLADDVAERALEGERPGIIGHHPAHAGHDLIDRVRGEIEILVEGDVVGHGGFMSMPKGQFQPISSRALLHHQHAIGVRVEIVEEIIAPGR
jgi:hypothetical protein